MSHQYDYFVIFAEMRTGSNFLEENVNSYPGLTCWGEAFNPAFIGKSKQKEMLGVSLIMREADPTLLLHKMRDATKGLAGFRFFHDHDPRILAHVLKDSKCAKIILTRNPLDSYVGNLNEEALAGNIDPANGVFTGTPDGIRGHVRRTYEAVGNPYMVTAGCEVPPGTAFENLKALCEPVQWRQ